VLRRIFVAKRGEVEETAYEELRNFYCPQNIVGVINSRRMTLAWHIGTHRRGGKCEKRYSLLFFYFLFAFYESTLGKPDGYKTSHTSYNKCGINYQFQVLFYR
jgi:hypothetical protein